MSTFAIVLGVGFVAGTLVFTDTLNRSFTALFASTVGDVVVEPDLTAHANEKRNAAAARKDRTLPGSLVRDLERVEGAARADGNVLDAAYVVDVNGKVMGGLGTALASNWTGAPAGHGLTGLEIVTGRAPETPDEVVLDAATVRRSGHVVGDEVTVVTSGDDGVLRPELVGVADFAEGGSFSGATWLAMTTDATQDLFLSGKNRFTSIWVTAAPGVTQSQLRDRVAAVVGDDVRVRTGDEVADESATQLLTAVSFLTTFLLVFAGISLVVGAFLIVNTFSILVAQRSRELALLRALGASRRQVTASVMLEAVVLGILGSTFGVLLGIATAAAIRALFSTFGLDLSGQPLVLGARTFVASYAVGVAVTVAAAWFPARRSARIAPVQAMRDDVAMPETSLRRRFGLGLGLVAFGVLAWVGQGVLPHPGWWVGAGALAILLGVASALPVLCRPFLALAAGLFAALAQTPGRLAGQNALRNPRRTSATAAALMIGLALAGTMSIVGESARASVDKALADSFTGDYVVQDAVGQPFAPSVKRALAKVDGVTEVAAQRWTLAQVGTLPQLLVAVDPDDLTGLFAVDRVAGEVTRLRRDEVMVSQGESARTGLGVGDTWTAEVDGKPVSLDVVGVFADTPVLKGEVVTGFDSLAGMGLPRRDNFVVVAAGSPGLLVERGIRDAVADLPTVNVSDQASYAAEQRRPIDQMVTMVFALLGLALVIAVLGIVNTLVLSVMERTKEIGLLRAVGLSRSQTRRMVTLESVAIAALGAATGLVLGVVFGVVLMGSLRDQGLDVVRVPWGQLAVFGAVALVVGVLAAVAPARRAAKLDVLAAISAT
ncbi:ABC transporter permease [Nocardioides yefusunii]|nr:ABC transporter permease [Nocardioides yefusunii]